ncbi:hypothetical protein G6F59_013041 [Rhizopus arrhizus]|nr:hypothetical protein G6F59_013041 [Rhizopus arrhizus]
MERLARPMRLAVMVRSKKMMRLNNLMLVFATLLLMAPAGPIPFSNTLPALALMSFAIGFIQRDGAAVAAGYAFVVATVVYFGVLLGGVGFAAESSRAMLDCTFQQQSSKLDSTRARSKAVEQARLYKATWLTPATRRRPRRRPPARLLVFGGEATDHGLRPPGRLAVLERHVHHFVAAQRRAVPAAVLADEGAAVVLRRQRLPGVEQQPQRCHVRADGVVGHDRLGHQVRPLRLHALIHVLAVVAVGPAVEAICLPRREVIRHQVGADLVALVGHRPQLAGTRLPVQAGRVADARCKDAAATGGHVHFQHHRAAVFHGQAVLGDVAVGAHAHSWLMVMGRTLNSRTL